MQRSATAPVPVVILGLLLAAGCRGATSATTTPRNVVLPPGAEALSLLGEPLVPPALSDDVRAEREAQLAEARRAHAANPRDLDAIVWLGRRTAYLGRYREALAIYTEGLKLHPDDPELLRHRGHRHITLREFDLAVADLERAAKHIEGQPDVVEPDGLPNARNVPTSTLHSNVWYHLALAHYLRGELDDAARCWRRCLEFSKNPDVLCATSHWLYMTLRRLGRDAEAEAVLEPITPEMDVIENHAYHALLLMYRGERTPEEPLPRGAGDSIESSTTGYGVAMWYANNGRAAEARELLERIVAGSEWAAFGHIAAEADLARE